jgi:hypothetical protein
MNPGLHARPEAPWVLWSGIAGALAVAALSVKSIHASASSTAALGYLVLPLIAALAAIPIGLWGGALGHVVLRLRGKLQSPPMVFVAALAVAAALPAFIGLEVERGLALEAAVREARGMGVLALDRAYETSRFRRDRYFLAVLAQNPAAREGLLARIAALQDPDLYEPLSSIWDVMGDNRKGLAVMRLVARHPATMDETLARLAGGAQAQKILFELAANPNTPPEVLARWYESDDPLAQWGLALNPKTPQRVLLRLAQSPNLYARMNLTRNPTTPREVLDRLAADPDPSVAAAAAQAIQRRRAGG